jgi:hypothetical protein
MKNIVPLAGMLFLATILSAQDSTHVVQRKNTIKLDLTSYYLYRNALSISYERITKPNQSFAITAGYQEFPRTGSLGDSIRVRENRDAAGFKIGGEYRFYLKKENKYRAPRGIYIGPYVAYHFFKNDRVIEVTNDGVPETASLNSKLTIFNVGFQLGYQFVIKNRWTIDLVLIGPAISNYKYTLGIGGNYTFDVEDVENEIVRDLIDKFPLLEEAIDENEASTGGRLDAWSYGYRYQLLIGYHFGRKKK